MERPHALKLLTAAIDLFSWKFFLSSSVVGVLEFGLVWRMNVRRVYSAGLTEIRCTTTSGACIQGTENLMGGGGRTVWGFTLTTAMLTDPVRLLKVLHFAPHQVLLIFFASIDQWIFKKNIISSNSYSFVCFALNFFSPAPPCTEPTDRCGEPEADGRIFTLLQWLQKMYNCKQ